MAEYLPALRRGAARSRARARRGNAPAMQRRWGVAPVPPFPPTLFFLFLCLDWTTTTMRGRELEDSDDPIDYIDTGQDRQRTHKEKEKKPEGRERIIPVIATTGFLEKNRGRRTK